MIQKLLAKRLADDSIDLVTATSPVQGLEWAVSLQPDLILLDVEMPVLDGWEVCRRLKANSFTRDIPVIFLTGSCSEEEVISGLDLGAIDFIPKPFSQGVLHARVRAALRTKYLLDLLSRRAMVDGLTGTWNRAYFNQRLESEVSAATRHDHPLACMICDIDHFKKINDTYGHAAGDQVLRRFAEVLSSTCRTEDVVCRYGGEEFVVLAPNTGWKAATLLAERLAEITRATPIKLMGSLVNITCSFGVAELGCTPGIIEAADEALYAAKRNGRDRVEVAACVMPSA